MRTEHRSCLSTVAPRAIPQSQIINVTFVLNTDGAAAAGLQDRWS